MARLLAFIVLTVPFLQAAPRLVDYALVLEEEPVARNLASRAALTSPDAQARMARVLDAQRTVRATLAAKRIPVDAAVQILTNTVFVSLPPERAAELRAIRGVVRVQRLPRVKRNLDRAIDIVRATQAWTAIGGVNNAGAGVKIGIVDSGIDKDHPGFQDSALAVPSGFPKGEAAYTNSKVIVARSYVNQLVNEASEVDRTHPDDATPRDRVGHGTAIAMIAAGARNNGAAGAIQGVAPKAWLGNYKIFGAPGVNDFTRYALIARALEDAFRDGMDIVTLSLGEGDPAIDGPLDRDAGCSADGKTVVDCDVRAQAVESAVRNGMVVVASAGNGGQVGLQYPTLSSIDTPGTAPSAITVGATTNSHVLFAGVTPQGGDRLYAIMGAGGRLGSALTAPLKDVGGDQLACAPLAGGSLAGAVALIKRGTCVFADKINFAQAAGAVAAIIYQASGDFPAEVQAQNVGIPAMGLGARDGATLVNLARNNVNVTLDPALRPAESTANILWLRSSRGPAVSTLGIKPELVAPGADIYTATQKLDPNGDVYHSSGYTSVTGTSYAAGFVAGAAALVKQKYPSMRPAQIKSAVVNTALQDVTDENGRARIVDAGAGRLNVADAVAVAATVEPAAISFGAIGTATLPSRVTLTLTNVSGAGATFNFAVAPRGSAPSASVSISPTSLTLSPGQQNSVTVTLQGTRPAAGMYEGFIDITGAGAALHVPYLYLVGDGVPYEAVPVRGVGFTGYVKDTGWLIGVRVLDRYGVPVTKAPVAWKTTAGNGKIDVGDIETVTNGLALASVNFGSTPGDQIYTATIGGLVQTFDGFARPLPSINSGGVLNAASNDTAAGRLAAGSYVSVYGSNLADTTAIASTASLPLSLAQTAVRFEAGGTILPGRLHFVSPGQINVQIPWEFEGQSSVQVKVSLPNITPATYAVFTVPLGAQAPGIFDRGGAAAARDVQFRVIDASNPARRGQAIQLYVNGLGPVDRTPASGEPTPSDQLARTKVNPAVTVGGRPAEVLFSGLAPGNVGLYQINLTLAADTPTGSQPVVVTIGGVASKPVNIPVQ
jgi:minor extracellular serine protease Vpr